MQTILVAGAGKSSIYLIEYLLNHAAGNDWKVIVADGSLQAIEEKTKRHPASEAAAIDITDSAQREPLIQRADIVVSLMPPALHIYLAKDCLKYKKNLITSSYVSDEIRAMDGAVKEAGLTFMCEMGLDPGIDHMTANQIIHHIQEINGKITAFKSYCGGLVAPESDNNPWHYKFSWNPRNVITAGLGGAKYMLDGKEIDVPYERMFKDNESIMVDGLGALAFYPNRDSLKYLGLYDVPHCQTFLRATLRHEDFCIGWNAIIKLGLTDDTDIVNAATYFDWIKEKTGHNNEQPLKDFIADKLGEGNDSKIINMLDWLGLFDKTAIPNMHVSSANILLDLLLKKWDMAPHEKDMVVMQHEVRYDLEGAQKILTSSMTLIGESKDHSAMAKTVGLPMGILARMVLNNKITDLPKGVLIPNMPEVYKPVLAELEEHGIRFVDKTV